MRRTFLAGVFLTVYSAGTCIPHGPIDTAGSWGLQDAIVVCGRLVRTRTAVTRWSDAGGFDAYQEHCSSDRDRTLPARPAAGCDTPRRYGVRAFLTDLEPLSEAADKAVIGRLRAGVDQIVLHYDAAGTSRRCFEVLHDDRGLSAHFLIDVDGMIYQTLDLRERARHAGASNDRSIGIEIANIGAYETPAELLKARRWDDGYGVASWRGRFATRGAVPVYGPIQGRRLYQYDFTPPQYEALFRLTRVLLQVFPRVEPVFPRDERGDVLNAVMSDEAREQFRGIVGHHHVSAEKSDPGPAFRWEAYQAAIGPSRYRPTGSGLTATHAPRRRRVASSPRNDERRGLASRAETDPCR